MLECACHFSIFDPKDGGKVVDGPAPRVLPALPLKIVDGHLVVARPFTHASWLRERVARCNEGIGAMRPVVLLFVAVARQRCRRPRCVPLGAAAAATRAAGSAATAMPMPAILQNYKPVTAERLKKPDDGDWLMVRRTYDGWGYSPLDQITPANVARLQPVWVFSTGVTNGHEAPPIVNNGVMFVATPGNQVIALDAKTGALLWRYRRPLPEDVDPAASRPAAASRCIGDKVFFAAGEAVLVALDARTGKEVWTTTGRRQQAAATTCRWRRSSPTAR